MLKEREYQKTIDDIKLSLNDIYMALLMSGWMLFLMGIYYMENYIICIGLFLIISNIWAIRIQFMITEKQYLRSMIPRHSMAIHMSKKLLNKENNIKNLLDNIITTQDDDIKFMKNNL